MSSVAAMAARSALGSTVARAAISGRLSSGAKVKSPRSPFGIPKHNPLSQSHRISRFPFEVSCCVESLLPYHSATASALLTSMLSVSRWSYGWTPEAVPMTDTFWPLLFTMVFLLAILYSLKNAVSLPSVPSPSSISLSKDRERLLIAELG